MSEDTLAQSIRAAMKAAMKNKDKDRLATIRLILAEFKRLVTAGWSPALKEMAKVVAKNLSDALTELKVAGWYPKGDHHLLAHQLLTLATDLARSATASSVNTQTILTKLRANLAKLTIPQN